ncbi:glutamate--cysteine ligase [Algoriphagus sp. oki45]|uniref:glutamate-cysteine ligase family protein n=1 Tax=Algoriphagus sp. oki45 TaxID=3067294 RepID=UPI0027F0DBFF|nr:glutamate--cysteine ligase [Algoriphagus sp. oki45]
MLDSDFSPMNQEDCLADLHVRLFSQKKSKTDPLYSPGKVGLEQEAFSWLRDPKNGQALHPTSLYEGQRPIARLLWEKCQAFGAQGHQFGAEDSLRIDKISFASGDNFQFEPGGQVEIATAPYPSLIELERQLKWMQRILEEIQEENPVTFAQIGTHPFFTGEEIGLQLPKPRYRHLQGYFNSLHPAGQQMMLQTCSQHINLDLGEEEETQQLRIGVAQVICPLLTAIFANSPTMERKNSGKKSLRSTLWKNLDSKRTGFWIPEKGDFSKKGWVEAYAQMAFQAPLMNVKGVDDRWFGEKITWAYWLENEIEDRKPTFSDWENHLSLLFPQVRMKGFLEVRATDALPRTWQLVPAAFLSGIFYSPHSLQAVWELLAPKMNSLNLLCQKASDGLMDDEIFRIAKEIFRRAGDGLQSLPESFRSKEQIQLLESYFEHFTAKRRTPAEELLEKLSSNKPLIY